MNEKVQAFLDKREAELDFQDQTYYYLVMKEAGLLSDEKEFFEVTEKEYKAFYTDSSNSKKENGKFYIMKKIPIEITDEEFEAVEKALPKEIMDDILLKSQGIDVDKEAENSTAAIFFTILAWTFWIGGFIISRTSSNVTREVTGYFSYTVTEFSFKLFMSTFCIYLISGFFCLCAAELFKKLQTIVNLLRRKQ